jgi:hypothetical protein
MPARAVKGAAVTAKETFEEEAIIVEPSAATHNAKTQNETGPVIATIDETGEVPSKVVAVSDPEVVVAEPTAPAPQIVYVTTPHPPKRRGNRALGTLIAVLASVVYAALLALVFAIVWASITGGADLGFVGSPNFYIPVAFFAAAMLLLVLVLNRAGWWSWVLGSIVVALVVYFGSAGVLILLRGAVLETAAAAGELYFEALLNPLVIIASLVAREVAIWAGVVISWRGRKVTARNVEARAAYDREQAERAAAHV